MEEKENKRYEDIVDLTFARPHKIKNKDELQLQQIYMEEKLNAIGKLERTKHVKTTSFGVSFGVITLAIFILGLLVAIKVNSIWGIIAGCMIAFVGLALILFETRLLIKVYSRERIVFDKKYEELKQGIIAILQTVKQLTGGEYEQE